MTVCKLIKKQAALRIGAAVKLRGIIHYFHVRASLGLKRCFTAVDDGGITVQPWHHLEASKIFSD